MMACVQTRRLPTCTISDPTIWVIYFAQPNLQWEKEVIEIWGSFPLDSGPGRIFREPRWESRRGEWLPYPRLGKKNLKISWRLVFFT